MGKTLAEMVESIEIRIFVLKGNRPESFFHRNDLEKAYKIIRQQAADIKALRETLDDACTELGKYIGCRCDRDDVEPGCCKPCQAMGVISDIGEALAATDPNRVLEDK